MTKVDIAERIQAKTGFTKRESSEILDKFFELLKETLKTGEKIKIAGFGNFDIKQKKDRKGRNPQTGETITIEARRIISFKPSTLLRNAINR